jgi:DNA mismatch endonuclease (patch repair protein)
MSLVRGKGNKSTEQRMAALLRKHRITGWRRHVDLPGRPDFAFQAPRKVAVFIDGCFWHRCRSCQRRLPRSNAAFWAEKIAGNVRRDHRADRELRAKGWKVLRIWEHALKNERAIERRVRRALDKCNSTLEGSHAVPHTQKALRRAARSRP